MALVAVFIVNGVSQTRAPRIETLLNGLKVYIINDPQAELVTAKIRVNAGAAFDQQGKEGTMKMLAESIFLTDEARQYFVDDMDGAFAVETNYDFIQLSVSGRRASMIDLLETLANAVTDPQIDKDTTEAVRSRVKKELAAKMADPGYIADRAAAERLFGTFPYGRPILGTNESLEKIDFADLRFAKSRFFGADNAVLTIRGNIDAAEAYRAVRRFFGAWLKSDRRVPATFRQPDSPDTSLLVKNISSDSGAEVRHTVRGTSRSAQDFAAMEILAAVLDARLKAHVAKVANTSAFVRNEAHMLPGQIVFAVSGIGTDAKVKLYPGGNSVDGTALIATLLSSPISADELRTAKNKVLAAFDSGSIDELWLDTETYKLPAPATQRDRIASADLTAVQKLADSIKQRPAVSLWMVKGIGSN